MTRILVILITTLSICVFSLAQDAPLSEADVQSRVDTISKTLRCVVCQNQSIFDSSAPLAQDMRRLVEARVRAGDTDDQVREHLTGPYGDFILMKPPFQMSTLLLWMGPVLILVIIFCWFFWRSRVKRAPITRRELSDEERQRVYNAALGDAPKDHQ